MCVYERESEQASKACIIAGCIWGGEVIAKRDESKARRERSEGKCVCVCL